MTGKFIFALLTACLCLTNQGCTYRAWYEGLQERQRQECYRLYIHGEIQTCLDRVNSISYDEYKKSRESSRKPPP